MKIVTGFGLPKPYSLFIPICIALSSVGAAACGGDPADGTPGDVSPDAPVPAALTASTNSADAVLLDWTAPKDRAPTGYVIQRDGADIATVSANPTRYNDSSAVAGVFTPPSALTASQGTRPEAVRLTWTASSSTPGKNHVYTVAALYDGERSAPSNQAQGFRAAPKLTGQVVVRDGKDLTTIAGDAATYDDATATAGTVGAPKAFSAGAGTNASAVPLAWGDSDLTPGPSHTYAVAALIDDKRSDPTNTVSGSRGAPFITGYVVTRDGADVATVPGSSRSYNDSTATAGSLTAPASFTATNGTRSDAVVLAWGASTSAPGPTHTYTIAAEYDATRSPASAPATGFRGAAVVDGYLLQRDGVTATTLLPTELTYVDFDATAGTASPPATISATSGTRSDAVSVTWSPSATTVGPTHAYTIMALADTRKGTAATASGSRGAPTITGYLVQRDGSDLDTVTGNVTTFLDSSANGGVVNAPTGLSATAGTRADAVALAWTAPTATAGQTYTYTVAALYDGMQGDFSPSATGSRGVPAVSAYVIQRDGTDLDTVPTGTLAYNDIDADPGTVTVPTAFTATQGTRADAVGLTWGPSTSNPGATHVYAVAAYYDDTQSAWSSAANGSRGKPVITGYLIQRDGSDLVTLGPTATSYDDTTVPYGTLSASISTVPDTARTYVQLQVTGAPTFTAPDPSSYWIMPVISSGDPPISDPISGFRGMGDKISYQWQRSTDDGTDGYADVAGVTGSTWFDGTSPIGVGRYYRATMKSDGASGTTDESRVELQGFTQVGVGQRHACGVRTDGTVVCWGDNALGQAPTDPTDSSFSSVSAGGSHTCAVREDLTVICWGSNANGQAPPDPSADAYRVVSAGALHTCGIRDEDGALACWGDNTKSQSTPPTGTFKQVSAGDAHTCAIRSDNKVLCWGDNTLGQAPAGPTSATFLSIATGTGHTCGVRSTDHAIECWGDDTKGQATPPTTGTFVEVAAGTSHTCARRNDDKIVCWGDDTKGQAPAGPWDGTFARVSAHGDVTCGTGTNNRIVCVGDNTNGQAPPPPPSQTFTSIAAGNEFACGVHADGTAACWGDDTKAQAPAAPSTDTFVSVAAGNAHACGIRSDKKAICWGDNTFGQAPAGPSSDSFTRISAGYDHTCGVRDDKKIVCWGNNALGQAPTTPSVDSFMDVAAGNGHTCGLRTDKKMLCWGDNTFGQAPATASIDSYSTITAGDGFTCGVRGDGKVICFGTNDFDQAPPGPSTDVFASVSAGHEHTCGVRNDKKVVCWGDNSRAQAPTTPSLDAFLSVTAGTDHTCGVRDDGKVLCWGQNDKSQAPRP